MTFRLRAFVCCFLLLTLAVSLAVVPATAASTIPEVERARFDSLSDKLFAPCCYAESVRVHRSSVAVEMRGEIANMMAQGKTDQQILDFYVQKYGERVLMVPEGGKRQWLFVIPFVMLVLGGLVVVLVLRRMKRIQPAPAATAPNATVEVKDSDLEW
jgi:cytochrome c-type biogenesis protein CcmH